MIQEIVSTIFELLFILFCIIAQIYLNSEWKKNKNKINLILIGILFSFQCAAILTLISFFRSDLIMIFGQTLNITIFLAIITVSIELYFILYLKKLDLFYSLPIVSGFFISATLFIFKSFTFPLLYELIISSITFIFLVFEAKKNGNILLLGLGLFFLTYGFSLIGQFSVVKSFFHLIAAIFLITGISLFYNKNLLLSRKEKNNLKNMWISRMVIEE